MTRRCDTTTAQLSCNPHVPPPLLFPPLPVKGDNDEAMRYYNRAIELHPDNAEAFVARGAAFANQQQLRRASQDFEHALELDPGVRNAGAYLEAVLRRMKEQGPGEGQGQGEREGGGGRDASVRHARRHEEGQAGGSSDGQRPLHHHHHRQQQQEQVDDEPHAHRHCHGDEGGNDRDEPRQRQQPQRQERQRQGGGAQCSREQPDGCAVAGSADGLGDGNGAGGTAGAPGVPGEAPGDQHLNDSNSNLNSKKLEAAGRPSSSSEASGARGVGRAGHGMGYPLYPSCSAAQVTPRQGMGWAAPFTLLVQRSR